MPRLGVPRRFTTLTTIAEMMTKIHHTIGFDQTLSHAHRIIVDHKLDHLPVLNGPKVVGFLSPRDLSLLIAFGGERRIADVAEAIATEFCVVAPGERVCEVARAMGLARHSCAVVVDVGRVSGIFAATDALTLLGWETN